MASAPRLTPEERARLEAYRPEDTPEARRARKIFWILVICSLLAHLTMLLVSAWLGHRREQADMNLASQEAVPVQFVEAPPEPSPEPPENPQYRSSESSRAESPEPTPPPEPAPMNIPRSLGKSPIPEAPRPAPSRAQPPAPPPEEAETEQPEEEQPGVGIGEQSSEKKRERLQKGLQGLGGVGQSWEDAAREAPDLGGGAFGGASLMFESTADVDWGPYAEQIKRIVRSNWRIAPAADYLDGIVSLHFFIRRDGTIEGLEYVSKTDLDPLDIPAHDALALSNPLPKPPLPENDPEERVGVRWSFLYNIDDREYRKWEKEQRWAERRRQANPR